MSTCPMPGIDQITMAGKWKATNLQHCCCCYAVTRPASPPALCSNNCPAPHHCSFLLNEDSPATCTASYNILLCAGIDIELNVFVFNSTPSWHMSATCYSDEYDDVMINVSWCSTTVQVSLHQVHLLTKPTVCSLHIILYNRCQRLYLISTMC